MAKITPPKHLTAEGRQLWAKLRADFQIDDSAGLVLLQAAAEAHERGQQARRLIAEQGLTVLDRFGQAKAHPATAVERDARAQLLAALRALRLSPEIE